jgi:hypothetical protein
MSVNYRVGEGKIYFNISSDGKMKTKCSPDSPGAICRKYEKKDGTIAEIYEKFVDKDGLHGQIIGINFTPREAMNGDKKMIFEDLLVSLSDGEVISMIIDSGYAIDFMKKLPNIDLGKDVILNAYSWIPPGKLKLRKGITIIQNGEKIKNFFWDGTNNLNGLPEREKEISAMTTDDWKIFFIKEKQFLKNYIEANIVPKLQWTAKGTAENYEPTEEYVEETSPVDDIPFETVSRVPAANPQENNHKPPQATIPAQPTLTGKVPPEDPNKAKLNEINKMAMEKLHVTIEGVPDIVGAICGPSLPFVAENYDAIIAKLKLLGA